MVYNVYGTKQADDAARRYNQLLNNAPTYSAGYEQVHAKNLADRAADTYSSTVNKGYQSTFGDQISALANRYRNNEFSWSAENSADYQTQKDYYRREGQKAQEHTQGAYSANTGGYGNSYAQAAGQRAYGQKMEELASKVPVLRNTALANWNQEQELTLNQIGLMKGLDEMDYSRYRDKVSDQQAFMEYYQNKYQTERGLDMTAFQNELQNWSARLSAAQSDLSNIRQLAESQYEHNTLSADARAAISQQQAQDKAYYDYLYSRI